MLLYIFIHLNVFIAGSYIRRLGSDSKLRNTFQVVRNEMEIQFR